MYALYSHASYDSLCIVLLALISFPSHFHAHCINILPGREQTEYHGHDNGTSYIEWKLRLGIYQRALVVVLVLSRNVWSVQLNHPKLK